MVELLVDGRKIEAREGATLLQACLGNGIYIPNLCHLDGMGHPPASCRMCFVEIEGEEGGPVPSCTVLARDGMEVRTDTPAVRRLQRSALRLLLSVHHAACDRCPANKRCELQRMARFLKVGLRPKQWDHLLKEPEIDDSHPHLDYHPNRCVLCGRCVSVCEGRSGLPLMTFANRGFDLVISFYGEKRETGMTCESCMECVGICPVGALTVRS